MSWNATDITPISNSIRNLGTGLANLALKKAQLDRLTGKDIYEAKLTDAKTAKAQAEADKANFTLQGMRDLWDAKQLDALSPRERTGIAVNMMAPRNVYGDAVDAETNRGYKQTLGANNTRVSNALAAQHYASANAARTKAAADAALKAIQGDYWRSRAAGVDENTAASVALTNAKEATERTRANLNAEKGTTEQTKQALNSSRVGTEGYRQQQILGYTENAKVKAQSEADMRKAQAEMYKATAELRRSKAATGPTSDSHRSAASKALSIGSKLTDGPLGDLALDMTGTEISPSDLHSYFSRTNEYGMKTYDTAGEASAIKRFTELHLPMTKANVRKYLADPQRFEQAIAEGARADAAPAAQEPAEEPPQAPAAAPAPAPAADAVNFFKSLPSDRQASVGDVVRRYKSGELSREQAAAELKNLGID